MIQRDATKFAYLRNWPWSGFKTGRKRARCSAGCFLVLGTQSAFAQGITNPAGGGVILVAFHILLGIGLLVYVLVSLATRNATGKARAMAVMIPLIGLYLVVGFVETYIAEHNGLVLVLYIEMLLLIVGTVLLIFRQSASRVWAIGGALVFVGVLNFLQPKLIDLQTRIYFDNGADMKSIAVSYPGHWREIHLQDGRVLLNINPHRKFGGSMRMIAEANRIKSPVTLGGQADGEQQVVFDVYNPVATRGTWGWSDRPKAFFNIPLFGTVHILKFENKRAGTALLLDENKDVKCRYLYEARGKGVPATLSNKHVVWSIEGAVDDGSVVECQQ